MSSKPADEPERESASVSKAELDECFVNLKSAIKLSDKFLRIFKSSYAFSQDRSSFSKKQFKTMERKMDQLYHQVTHSRSATLDDIVALAYSYQFICCAYTLSASKEEIYIAENSILRCLNLVRDKELDAKTILIALKGYYNLGYIYNKQKGKEKTIEICNKGVELYLTYTQESEGYGSPVDFGDILFKSQLDDYTKLRRVYRYILKLLLNLSDLRNNPNLYITYTHLLLAADLSTLKNTKQRVNWIIKTLLLCDLLLKYNRLAEARSHITTAMYVQKVFIEKKYNSMEQFPFGGFMLINQTSDSLFAIYWVKYGSALLRRSAERLLRLEDSALSNLKSEYPANSNRCTSQRLLLFKEIGRGIPLPDEYQPRPDYCILDYNNAHRLFYDTLYYFNIGISNLDHKKISTYAQLILNMSNVYKYMALYEKNAACRILLQNRCIDLLSEATKNKAFFMKPEVSMCLQFQLAFGYATLINEKLENLDTIHSLYKPQMYDKIMFEIECLIRNALTNLKASATFKSEYDIFISDYDIQ